MKAQLSAFSSLIQGFQARSDEMTAARLTNARYTEATLREWNVIRAHPIWGADVVSHAELHQMVVNVVHYHHERYDGKGYPAGLKGEEIPIEASIVAVADVFDAITTDRSYRKKLSKAKAAHILLSQKGKQLDAKIVDLFVRNIGE